MPNNKKSGSDLAKGLAFVSQIGIMITVCVCAGVYLGRFLDGLWGTSPWLLIFFSLSGAGAAFKSIVHLAGKQ